MNNLDRNKVVPGSVGDFDRIARVVVGLVALSSMLYFAVTQGQAYSLPMMIAAIVVLSGIAGWDPLYALKDVIFGRKSGAIRRPGNVAQTPA